MPALPTRFAEVILCFAPPFRHRTWRHAQQLLIGAILAPGARTVTSVLRVLGLGGERHFVNFHRVLSRAVWSPRASAGILLRLLVRTFVNAQEPIVLGIDNTLERRRGARISAKGIYHDAVRSSRSHFVKASGLRWLSVMLLAEVPFARRIWALPCLTALAPSKRYHEQRCRRHKSLTEIARQLLMQARRFVGPARRLIVVADAGFAALELLTALRTKMTVITQLRLDAQLYAPAPARRTGRSGRPRIKGQRLTSLKQRLLAPDTSWRRLRLARWYGAGPRLIELCAGTALWYHAGCTPLPIRWILIRDPKARFEPRALLSTDASLTERQILEYFMRRWQVEVTFEESRRHLGFETQRQWSDPAIARTTPVILALFSIVTLLAMRLRDRTGALPIRTAAWYVKPRATFADALALVRGHLWRHRGLSLSSHERDVQKAHRAVLKQLHEAVCYAA